MVAARKAFGPWSGATAYNRGQVLYRVAEMLEGRRDQFVAEVAEADDLTPRPGAVVDAAVDRWVWYAGWSDKIHQVAGRPTRWPGPTSTSRCPSPPAWWRCWPRRDRRCSAWCRSWPRSSWGQHRVVVASEAGPLPAVTLSEVLATSDLPGGVVNLLTGSAAEIGPWLASHMDVNAIDLAGVTDAELAADLEREAAGNLKRVVRPPAEVPDWAADPGPDRMLAYMETKTVWHPVGT